MATRAGEGWSTLLQRPTPSPSPNHSPHCRWDRRQDAHSRQQDVPGPQLPLVPTLAAGLGPCVWQSTGVRPPPPTSGRRYDGNITGEETKHRKVKSGPEPKRPRDTRQVKPLGSDDVRLGAGNNQVA